MMLRIIYLQVISLVLILCTVITLVGIYIVVIIIFYIGYSPRHLPLLVLVISIVYIVIYMLLSTIILLQLGLRLYARPIRTHLFNKVVNMS